MTEKEALHTARHMAVEYKIMELFESNNVPLKCAINILESSIKCILKFVPQSTDTDSTTIH